MFLQNKATPTNRCITHPMTLRSHIKNSFKTKKSIKSSVIVFLKNKMIQREVIPLRSESQSSIKKILLAKPQKSHRFCRASKINARIGPLKSSNLLLRTKLPLPRSISTRFYEKLKTPKRWPFTLQPPLLRVWSQVSPVSWTKPRTHSCSKSPWVSSPFTQVLKW